MPRKMPVFPPKMGKNTEKSIVKAHFPYGSGRYPQTHGILYLESGPSNKPILGTDKGMERI